MTMHPAVVLLAYFRASTDTEPAFLRYTACGKAEEGTSDVQHIGKMALHHVRQAPVSLMIYSRRYERIKNVAYSAIIRYRGRRSKDSSIVTPYREGKVSHWQKFF